jgi:hypothetical protein
MQTKSYLFPIDPLKFDYYLSEEQESLISFTCDDPEFYDMFGEGPNFDPAFVAFDANFNEETAE